jgi:4-amino-4-deoxy-L-arabinose transferase-like glycosyltransferase
VLLSYLELSYLAKAWVFFGGVFIPYSVFFSRPMEATLEKEKTYQKEAFPPPGAVTFWIAFGSLALFVRILRITQFYLWPTGDEALHGFLAISLLRNWNWHFFYTVGEHPPLLIWALALLFKVFNSPFAALWFLPALFSSITIPMGYLCAKEILPKSASALFCFLLAFSFWPIYLGRFCHQGLFIPFWELSSFFLMSRWMKSAGESKRALWPFLLGLWCGLGTLTFISWVFVLFLLLTFVFIFAYQKLLPNVFIFFISLAAGLSPLSWLLLKKVMGTI